MSGKACDIVVVGTKTVGGTGPVSPWSVTQTMARSIRASIRTSNAAGFRLSVVTLSRPAGGSAAERPDRWWPATTIALTATTSTSRAFPARWVARSEVRLGRPSDTRRGAGHRYQRGHAGQQHDCCRRGVSGHGIRHHGFRPGPIRRGRRDRQLPSALTAFRGRTWGATTTAR